MRCRYCSVLFLFTLALFFFSCDQMQTEDVIRLTVDVSGPGIVRLNPDKSFYGYGETVVLTAVSYASEFSPLVHGGCEFDSWEDDDGSGPARTVILTANVSLNAFFCIDPDGDSDGDGKINRYEIDESGTPVDSDSDGIPDYLEWGYFDTGSPVTDPSFDGVLYEDVSILDTDKDGSENCFDSDDDGDSRATLLEDLNGNGCWFDDDPNGNGIPAYLDPAE
jgi:hypothetical protein